MEKEVGRCSSVSVFSRYALLFGDGSSGHVHGSRLCHARSGHGENEKYFEILTKNIALFSIASLMYLICGYSIMYSDGAGWIPGFGSYLGGGDNTVEEVLASGGDVYYSGASDFFFQVVFVATAMSIISGAVAERMKLSPSSYSPW